MLSRGGVHPKDVNSIVTYGRSSYKPDMMANGSTYRKVFIRLVWKALWLLESLRHGYCLPSRLYGLRNPDQIDVRGLNFRGVAETSVFII